YAELLDGCHYDKRTGLAYLPKELFGRDLLSIQVQLMHVLSDYEDAMTEVDTAGGRKSENYTTLSSLIDQETVVQAASGLKEERLSVSVNGIPYPEDSYRYDARTGILAIDAPPAVCQTVSVRDDRSVFEKAADAIDMTQTAQALSYTKMHFYKKAKIRLEQWLVDSIKTNGNVSVKKGLFTGTAKVKYSSGQINADGLDQYHYGYKGGEEGLKKLVKAIESGKSLSKSSLMERTKKFALFDFRVDLDNNKLKLKHNKSKTGKFLEDWGKFTLECAHTASSVLGNNGKKDSFTTGKYSQSKVALRFLNINVEKGYAIVGIITGRQWTQMGANVFKLHIEVPPEYDYPSYQVEKSFEENVKVTIRKKDTVTGKLLGGAKFDLYENGKKVAGSPFVTETDASKSDYGTVTYAYARKSEPYRIDIKKEDEISKKYKYCTNWDLLSASQQKKITGKGIYKSEKAAMKVLKEWCDRKIAEQREDFYAKVHTWKAVEIDPPDGHVIKKESISQTEDANESTITFAFADEEQTGAITIIKKAKMPDGKLSNMAKGTEAELSGAVYGIYAAETITGSDNRTVVYKKDAKVAEVKLKKKN
ncbi:MAG: hypothetical protein IIY96_07085, partial [Lachnospiraceae bacterium]|nr:hypothetical protein [Lachnospiraceae bacterium]